MSVTEPQANSISEPGRPGPSAFGMMLSWAGALTSVALIAGLALWGYRLTVRDVSGVPVVQALEGPMRVQPEEPGGEEAAHQGLAVNAVQAAGVAEDTPDQVVLAPKPIDLGAAAPKPLDDDQTPVAEADETPSDTDTAIQAALAAAQDSDDPVAAAEALAAAVADGVEPLAPAQAPTGGAETAISTDVPGVKRSPRPAGRPTRDLAAEAAVQSVQLASADAGTPVSVDPDKLTPGTRLVQLGAFDSEEVAVSEWQKLAGRFGPYMEGKGRVIQKAQSGGRTFFRLRATGFADIGDARRFCSALLAENAACIPVVAR